jgi:hypothetical protein
MTRVRFKTTHASDAFVSLIQVNLCRHEVIPLAALSSLSRSIICRLAQRDVRSGSKIGLCAITVVEGLL